jgi:hypothetical protein
MAMVRVEPVSVRVRTGWFDGRPREIAWGDRSLPITHLETVRDEISASPVVAGPRTVYVVDTPQARITLTYRHRSKRWTIDGFDGAATAA